MMASQTTKIRIVGIGTQTPVGTSVAATAAAIRARLPMIALHPFLVDRFGERVSVAQAPWLPAEVPLLERLLMLAAGAASEALSGLKMALAADRVRIGVALGLPSKRPGLPPDFADRFSALLKSLLPSRVTMVDQKLLLLGHVAGVAAIEEGCRLIREGNADVCLVGGVESYIDRTTVEWIDWTGGLHAPTNSWGFIPGEASGFCVLASDEFAAASQLPTLGLVLGASMTVEPKLRRDRAVCIGEGLSESFRRTLCSLPDSVLVDQIICDLNGEPHRAEEFGFTMMRLGKRFADPGRFQTPADCWGDVGAASGTLFVALAVMAGRNGYAEGPTTLIWSSAMVAERSSALIHVEPCRKGGA
jgi:3-oxoacyl-[acyl-carrier-protein] synthase I